MAIVSAGTTLEISGSAGGAETISDMTLSNPTILTSAAHSIEEGDVVTLADFAGADAGDLNGESTVAIYITTNTFAIPIDTTGKTIDDNSNTATATPVSWTEIGEITDEDGPKPSVTVIDVTHLGSTAKEKLAGLVDSGQVSLSINWYLDSDSGQQAAATAMAAGTQKNFRVTWSDSSTATFAGYVTSIGPGAAVDDKVSGSITIDITGVITWSSL